MPEVDSQRREEGDEVDDEEPLFPAVGLAILLTYCVLLGQPPENAGEEHVTEGCRDKHNESIFVDGEVLGGGDVGEHEQREVLHHIETEVNAAEKAVTRTWSRTAEVVVPIGEGCQEAGCRVQANAETPHVALGDLPTNGGAH